MNIEYWQMSADLKQELDAHYKTAYSLSLANHEPLDIARALTFDGLANSITPADLARLLSVLNTKFLSGGIKGVGLEIGSGPGTFVAAFANMPSVSHVYGIEACEAIVKELMSKVVSYIAGENTHKLTGAIADFNHLGLPDASVDFVFDFFSLHHSTTPAVTLRELSRVLKTGGVIVCLDKARADSLSDADLDALLDIEYPRDAKIGMGVSPEVRHTRRMNGENEYRLKDWNAYFTAAGFGDFKHYNVAKIGGIAPVKVIKQILAFLPIPVQIHLSKYVSKRITNNLEPSNRIFTNIFPKYPREFSLMTSRRL